MGEKYSDFEKSALELDMAYNSGFSNFIEGGLLNKYFNHCDPTE